MRKLKLDLEKLDVQSFETAREPRDAGTVQGQNVTDPAGPCTYDTCGYFCTQKGSCVETCANESCGGYATLCVTVCG